MNLIKQIRNDNELTQRQMAKKLSISQGLVSVVESGQVELSMKLIIKIISRLKLTGKQKKSLEGMMIA